jgi:hypothetical protein
MRAFGITLLLVAFVLAVILPNDIGTHELPMTGQKCVKVGKAHPFKVKLAAWCIQLPNRSDASPAADARLIAPRGVRPKAAAPYSPPLLI